jgi:uncharacterized protein YcfJ
MIMKNLLIGCGMLALLTGCNTTNQQNGTLIGAGAGGLLGSQVGRGTGRIVATGIGVLLGAMAGDAVGQNMDQPKTTTVIYQNTNVGQCGNITNTGVRSSCERGLSDRRAAEQRKAQNQAYACSRYGRC